MTADIAKHRSALRTSSRLTEMFRSMYQPTAAPVRPEKVIRVLTKANVKFVLTGTHGAGRYRSQPRATQDVDILVSKRDYQKAIAAIRDAFPKLLPQATESMTQFVEPVTGKGVIDLMAPDGPVSSLTFKNSVRVENGYRIPNLEMALVAKYAAIKSPEQRLDRKYLLAGDLLDMIRHNLEELNLDRLRRLADAVRRRGGTEVIAYVEGIRADRKLWVSFD